MTKHQARCAKGTKMRVKSWEKFCQIIWLDNKVERLSVCVCVCMCVCVCVCVCVIPTSRSFWNIRFRIKLNTVKIYFFSKMDSLTYKQSQIQILEFSKTFTIQECQQECIPVGCVPSFCSDRRGGGWCLPGVSAQVHRAGGCLPKCTPRGQNSWHTLVKTLPFRNFVCGR